MSTHLGERFARLPTPVRFGTALASMVGLGVIDYLTGHEISFALFYLIPVAVAAWFVDRSSGLVVSVGCAISWHLANSLAGETFSTPSIPYWNAVTRLGFFFVVTWLLAALRDALTTARELSRTDPLTGALNSRAFREMATLELRRARHLSLPLSLVYIDLDNFKAVNDAHGHGKGDDLLREVVRTIQAQLPESGVAARLGGDEFALLLPGIAPAATGAAVERIRDALLERMSRGGWPVTFSIGVLQCDVPPEEIDDLLHDADQLMYSVKSEGKDAVRYATRTGRFSGQVV